MYRNNFSQWGRCWTTVRDNFFGWFVSSFLIPSSSTPPPFGWGEPVPVGPFLSSKILFQMRVLKCYSISWASQKKYACTKFTAHVATLTRLAKSAVPAAYSEPRRGVGSCSPSTNLSWSRQSWTSIGRYLEWPKVSSWKQEWGTPFAGCNSWPCLDLSVLNLLLFWAKPLSKKSPDEQS